MVDPNKIGGTPGQKGIDDTPGKKTVDPEKFKRVLKVDETNPDEQKGRPYPDDEELIEEHKQAAPPPPPKPFFNSSNPAGEETPDINLNENSPEVTPESPRQPFDLQENTPSRSNRKKEASSKQHSIDATKGPSDSKDKKELQANKKKERGPSKPGVATKEDDLTTQNLLHGKEVPIQAKKPNNESEKLSTSAPPLGKKGNLKDEKKEETKKTHFEGKVDMTALSKESPLPIDALIGIHFEAGLPSYSQLSSKVFELFQKMTGLLLVEKENGISKTSVTLNMPSSPFNKATIVIDHYDTAPHSFNLTLKGSPEAVKLFSAHLNELAAAFNQNRFAFEVNLKTPILLAKDRAIKVKKVSGGKKEKKK